MQLKAPYKILYPRLLALRDILKSSKMGKSSTQTNPKDAILKKATVTQNKEKFETRKLPMMPIRDVVIFPYMMTPFIVGRESSVRALEEALASDRKIFLATQHDASIDEPKPHEIYQVGTIANIVQNLKLPDGNIKVLVEGVERGKILKLTNVEGYFEAEVRTVKYPTEPTQGAGIGHAAGPQFI